eukprot:gnl/Chilomastix_cuspidata/4092.p1 GENE.gnl/Chilomastix_cuspidata/4092~~gnl/Chilomastix_cuspidata/4092.p1  ORF type:complete len:3550 (+),score=701.57 gnl/Chilomastix_cuspidata/4092:3-10652(+)
MVEEREAAQTIESISSFLERAQKLSLDNSNMSNEDCRLLAQTLLRATILLNEYASANKQLHNSLFSKWVESKMFFYSTHMLQISLSARLDILVPTFEEFLSPLFSGYLNLARIRIYERHFDESVMELLCLTFSQIHADCSLSPNLLDDQTFPPQSLFFPPSGPPQIQQTFQKILSEFDRLASLLQAVAAPPRPTSPPLHSPSPEPTPPSTPTGTAEPVRPSLRFLCLLSRCATLLPDALVHAPSAAFLEFFCASLRAPTANWCTAVDFPTLDRLLARLEALSQREDLKVSLLARRKAAPIIGDVLREASGPLDRPSSSLPTSRAPSPRHHMRRSSGVPPVDASRRPSFSKMSKRMAPCVFLAKFAEKCFLIAPAHTQRVAALEFVSNILMRAAQSPHSPSRKSSMALSDEERSSDRRTRLHRHSPSIENLRQKIRFGTPRRRALLDVSLPEPVQAAVSPFVQKLLALDALTPSRWISSLFSGDVAPEAATHSPFLAKTFANLCSNQISIALGLLSRCIAFKGGRDISSSVQQAPRSGVAAKSIFLFSVNEHGVMQPLSSQLALFEQISPFIHPSVLLFLILLLLDLLKTSKNISQALLIFACVIWRRMPFLLEMVRANTLFQEKHPALRSEPVVAEVIGIVDRALSEPGSSYHHTNCHFPENQQGITRLMTLRKVLSSRMLKEKEAKVVEEFSELFLLEIFRRILYFDMGERDGLGPAPGGYFPRFFLRSRPGQGEGATLGVRINSMTLIGVFQRSFALSFIPLLLDSRNYPFAGMEEHSLQHVQGMLLKTVLGAFSMSERSAQSPVCQEIFLLEALDAILFPSGAHQIFRNPTLLLSADALKKTLERKDVFLSIALSLKGFLSRLCSSLTELADTESPTLASELLPEWDWQTKQIYSHEFFGQFSDSDKLNVSADSYTYEGVSLTVSIRMRLELFCKIEDAFSIRPSQDALETLLQCGTMFGPLSCLVCDGMWGVLSGKRLSYSKGSLLSSFFSLLFNFLPMQLRMDTTRPKTSPRSLFSSRPRRRPSDASRGSNDPTPYTRSLQELNTKLISKSFVRTVVVLFTAWTISRRKAKVKGSKLRGAYTKKPQVTHQVLEDSEDSSSSLQDPPELLSSDPQSGMALFQHLDSVQFSEFNFSFVSFLFELLDFPPVAPGRLSAEGRPPPPARATTKALLEVIHALRCVLTQASLKAYLAKTHKAKTDAGPVSFLLAKFESTFAELQRCCSRKEPNQLVQTQKELLLRQITFLYSACVPVTPCLSLFLAPSTRADILLRGTVEFFISEGSGDFVSSPMMCQLGAPERVFMKSVRREILIEEDPNTPSLCIRFETRVGRGAVLADVIEAILKHLQCTPNLVILELRPGPMILLEQARSMRVGNLALLSPFSLFPELGEPSSPRTDVSPLNLKICAAFIPGRAGPEGTSCDKSMTNSVRLFPKILFTKKSSSKNAGKLNAMKGGFEIPVSLPHLLLFNVAQQDSLVFSVSRLLMMAPPDAKLVDDIRKASSLSDIRELLLFSVGMKPATEIFFSNALPLNILQYPQSALLFSYVSRLLLRELREERRHARAARGDAPQERPLLAPPRKSLQDSIIQSVDFPLQACLLLYEIADSILQRRAPPGARSGGTTDGHREVLPFIEQIFETSIGLLELGLSGPDEPLVQFSPSSKFRRAPPRGKTGSAGASLLYHVASHLLSTKFWSFWPLEDAQTLSDAAMHDPPEEKLCLAIDAAMRSLKSKERDQLFKEILGLATADAAVPAPVLHRRVLVLLEVSADRTLMAEFTDSLLVLIQKNVEAVINSFFNAPPLLPSGLVQSLNERTDLLRKVLRLQPLDRIEFQKTLLTTKKCGFELFSCLALTDISPSAPAPAPVARLPLAPAETNFRRESVLCHLEPALLSFLNLIDSISEYVLCTPSEVSAFLEDLLLVYKSFPARGAFRSRVSRVLKAMNKKLLARWAFTEKVSKGISCFESLEHFFFDLRWRFRKREQKDNTRLLSSRPFWFRDMCARYSGRKGYRHETLPAFCNSSLFGFVSAFLYAVANSTSLRTPIETNILNSAATDGTAPHSVLQAFLSFTRGRNAAPYPLALDAFLIDNCCRTVSGLRPQRAEVDPVTVLRVLIEALLNDETKFLLTTFAKSYSPKRSDLMFDVVANSLVLDPRGSVKSSLQHFFESKTSFRPLAGGADFAQYTNFKQIRVFPTVFLFLFEANTEARNHLSQRSKELERGVPWDTTVCCADNIFEATRSERFVSERRLFLKRDQQIAEYVFVAGVWAADPAGHSFIALSLSDGVCELSNLRERLVVDSAYLPSLLKEISAVCTPLSLLYIDRSKGAMLLPEVRADARAHRRRAPPDLLGGGLRRIKQRRETHNLLRLTNTESFRNSFLEEAKASQNAQTFTFFLKCLIFSFSFSELSYKLHNAAAVGLPEGGEGREGAAAPCRAAFEELTKILGAHTAWLESLCHSLFAVVPDAVTLGDVIKLTVSEVACVDFRWPSLGLHSFPRRLDIPSEAKRRRLSPTVAAFFSHMLLHSEQAAGVSALFHEILSSAHGTANLSDLIFTFSSSFLEFVRWGTQAGAPLLAELIWENVAVVMGPATAADGAALLLFETGWLPFICETLERTCAQGHLARAPPMPQNGAHLTIQTSRQPHASTQVTECELKMVCLLTFCFARIALAVSRRPECGGGDAGDADVFLDKKLWDLMTRANLGGANLGQVESLGTFLSLALTGRMAEVQRILVASLKEALFACSRPKHQDNAFKILKSPRLFGPFNAARAVGGPEYRDLRCQTMSEFLLRSSHEMACRCRDEVFGFLLAQMLATVRPLFGGCDAPAPASFAFTHENATLLPLILLVSAPLMQQVRDRFHEFSLLVFSPNVLIRRSVRMSLFLAVAAPPAPGLGRPLALEEGYDLLSKFKLSEESADQLEASALIASLTSAFLALRPYLLSALRSRPEGAPREAGTEPDYILAQFFSILSVLSNEQTLAQLFSVAKTVVVHFLPAFRGVSSSADRNLYYLVEFVAKFFDFGVEALARVMDCQFAVRAALAVLNLQVVDVPASERQKRSNAYTLLRRLTVISNALNFVSLFDAALRAQFLLNLSNSVSFIWIVRTFCLVEAHRYVSVSEPLLELATQVIQAHPVCGLAILGLSRGDLVCAIAESPRNVRKVLALLPNASTPPCEQLFDAVLLSAALEVIARVPDAQLQEDSTKDALEIFRPLLDRLHASFPTTDARERDYSVIGGTHFLDLTDLAEALILFTNRLLRKVRNPLHIKRSRLPVGCTSALLAWDAAVRLCTFAGWDALQLFVRASAPLPANPAFQRILERYKKGGLALRRIQDAVELPRNWRPLLSSLTDALFMFLRLAERTQSLSSSMIFSLLRYVAPWVLHYAAAGAAELRQAAPLFELLLTLLNWGKENRQEWKEFARDLLTFVIVAPALVGEAASVFFRFPHSICLLLPPAASGVQFQLLEDFIAFWVETAHGPAAGLAGRPLVLETLAFHLALFEQLCVPEPCAGMRPRPDVWRRVHAAWRKLKRAFVRTALGRDKEDLVRKISETLKSMGK